MKKLVFVAIIMVFVVVALGAYVRLSDAGLGCPDWPGCYGHVGVPSDPQHQAEAAKNFPNAPLDITKAWKEMVHRYFASSLGFLIILITYFAWRKKVERVLATLLLGVVIFQGMLGMWTVTLLLKPVVVTAHLIGGMATLGLLITLFSRLHVREYSKYLSYPKSSFPLRLFALLTLVVVAGQIALGGWVSSNYAALACTGFPACNGSFNPPMDFEHAFTLWRNLGETVEGKTLPSTSLIAIHWLHRWGALIVTFFVAALAGVMWMSKCARVLKFGPWVAALLLLLSIQITLGVLNVVLSLPLAIAVLHNLGAAALLSALILLNFSLSKRF